jgi:HAD superfamily phosphoserine phosphatase-like hydrolase
MRDLCLFDLDGTLIEHDSFGQIVRRNLARHPVLAAAGLARKAGLLSRAGFAQRAHRQLISPLRDSDLQVIADEVAAQVVPARRTILESWRDRGAYLVLMSASPHEYVARVGIALGFDAAYGSRFEGAGYLHLYGPAKLEFLKKQHPAAHWRRVFAISDSTSDEALLAAFESSQMV